VSGAAFVLDAAHAPLAGPHTAGRAVPGARAWLAALRVCTQKELRDLAWLALGVALGVCLIVFGAAQLFDLVVPLFIESERQILGALALFCVLPLAAEVFCADARTSFARWQQGSPATLTLVLSAKALALALYGALFVLVLLGTTLALHTPEVNWSVQDQSLAARWLTFAAPMALGAVTLTAAVTRHSLASLLAGVGALVLCAAPIAGAARDHAPSFFMARVLQYWFHAVGSLAGVGWVAALLLCAVPVLRLRGRVARSVAWRAALASSCVGALVGLSWARQLPAALAATRLPFDDAGARVARLLPSPDGTQLALELEHSSGRDPCTWWLIDVESERSPMRLSTESVVARTALGSGWQAELLDWSVAGDELLDWSVAGDELLGWSAVSSEHGTATTWSLSPASLDVRYLSGGAYADAIGDTLRRQAAPTESDGVRQEVWSLRDGSHALTVACEQRLVACLRAPGVGYFLDAVREVHRVDLLAGSSRGLGVVVGKNAKPPRFSDDGRWMILERDGKPRRIHTLIDVESGASTEFDGQYRWGRYEAPVLVPLDRDGAPPRPGQWARSRPWRIVSSTGTRDVDFGVEVRELHPLADGRWIATSDDRRDITLHAADGTLLRTLRARAQGATR